MTTTELAPPRRTNGGMIAKTPDMGGMDLRTMGDIFARSGFFQDSRDAAQAIVKIQAGAELGFPPVVSMTGVYIVKGKVSLSANLMAAAIKRSQKYNYHVRQLDDDACELDFAEGGKIIGVSRFTHQDAKAANLTGDNWKNFRRNMLFARALSNGAKWYCPDIFGGPVYTPDELGADVDGATGEPRALKSPPANRPAAPANVNTNTGEVLDDAPDLSRDDDFLFLWDATAEGKGLDHKTGRSLLGAACKKRKVDFFTADLDARQQLINDLKAKTPAELEKFRQAAQNPPQSTTERPGVEAPDANQSPSAPAPEPSIDQAADAIGAGDLTAELWAEFQSNLWDVVREKNDNRKLYDNAVKAWLVKLSLVGKGEQTTMEARRQFMECAEQERGAWAYLAK